MRAGNVAVSFERGTNLLVVRFYTRLQVDVASATFTAPVMEVFQWLFTFVLLG